MPRAGRAPREAGQAARVVGAAPEQVAAEAVPGEVVAAGEEATARVQEWERVRGRAREVDPAAPATGRAAARVLDRDRVQDRALDRVREQV